MKSRFALDDDRCRGGLTSAEARALLAGGKRADIDARCVGIFAGIARRCDVVIVEGTDLTGQDAAVEVTRKELAAEKCTVLAIMVKRGADPDRGTVSGRQYLPAPGADALPGVCDQRGHVLHRREGLRGPQRDLDRAPPQGGFRAGPAVKTGG